MTYCKSLNHDEIRGTKCLHDPSICFCCNEKITEVAVFYFAKGGIVMHRDCDFAMANRIICDCWPNRRDGGYMKCNAR